MEVLNMNIETQKRGVNKDECFCGSEKEIKNLLYSLHLADNYFTNIDFGYGSYEVLKRKVIFRFWYSSRKYGDIEENKGKHQLQFSFFPLKKREITEAIKDEFTKRVLPIVKQEIISCVMRNDIIDFVSGILVSLEGEKLKIEKEKNKLTNI